MDLFFSVPGSGKSSFAKSILATMECEGISARVHSTDEYFMVDGRYIFDIRKLGEYHRRNLEAFKASLAEGIGLGILDNAVPDLVRHADSRWDEETLTLVRLDTPVVPFDFDDVIVVKPEDYHALKDLIGEMVLPWTKTTSSIVLPRPEDGLS